MTKGQIDTYLSDIGLFRRVGELEAEVKKLTQDMKKLHNELYEPKKRK